jgi:hypothetical protein
MVEIQPLMNSHDQATRQVRLAATLIFSWGVTQFMMNWPFFTFTPFAGGNGGSLHQDGATGIPNILCGIGIWRYFRSARTLGLFLAQLRTIGCLLDILELLKTGFWHGQHVLHPMPPAVEKLLIGPFLIAQAYIIWVLTRDDVIARFASPRPPPLPAAPSAGAS